MAIFEQQRESLSASKLDLIRDRAAEYGKINLDDAVNVAEKIRAELQIADSFDEIDLPADDLRSFAINPLSSGLNELLSQFEAYAENGPTSGHSAEEIEGLARAILAQVQSKIRPVLPRSPHSPESVRSELEGFLAEVKRRQEELVAASEAATEGKRDDSAGSATVELAEFYEDAAKEYSTAATNFRKLGFVGLALFTAASVLAFLILPTKYDPEITSKVQQAYRLVGQSGGRLLLLSIAAYLAAFGFRNYRVNKHLQTLNSRRAIALKTSNRLREALSDPDSRNIIVAELVRSIFTSEETGYLGSGSDRTVIESPGSMLPALASLSQRGPRDTPTS